ncbi:MAG: GTPase ObgE [candidate division Zixibacteria bacterium]|nr:GTPase ObgE [Candidatus Tariuqbacter arcticus]
MFIDTAQIEIASGKGGSGIVSFHREKFIPKGGPDGGNGGKGGDVILTADQKLHTLMDYAYKRKYKAGNGRPGGSNNRKGASGKDLKIRLPVGTIVFDRGTDELLGDLTADGQQLAAARGGRGGFGNAHFKSSINRAPRAFTPGEEGEYHSLRLELKLLADVGLVGLPNAGKSTLLSRLSAARPKIAPYPFTTLIPNLGIVKAGEYSSFVMADIPGLIEGAHQGKGLGDEFLRHIERTQILLFLIDITSNDIGRDYHTLENELESFDPALIKKPRLTALTKADLLSDLPQDFTLPVDIVISAVSGYNLLQLTGMLYDRLKQAWSVEDLQGSEL